MSGSTLTPNREDQNAVSADGIDNPKVNTAKLAEEPVDIAPAKPKEEPVDIAPPKPARKVEAAKSEVAKVETAKSAAAKVVDAKGEAAKGEDDEATPVDAKTTSTGRALAGRTITMKALVSGIAALIVVAVLAVLVWMVVAKSSEISDMKAANADTAHAEQVALDYSTGAAEMSYEDTQGWLKRLTANTTPELGTRLRNAAGQMEQLLRPLQWSSTSSPISAKVTSVDGDVLKVNAFVGIVTKNVQAPAEGVETTATYKLTIDKAQDWKITAITSNGTNLTAGGAAPENPVSQNPAPATTQQPAAPQPAAPGN